jgi:hypothetical protein
MSRPVPLRRSEARRGEQGTNLAEWAGGGGSGVKIAFAAFFCTVVLFETCSGASKALPTVGPVAFVSTPPLFSRKSVNMRPHAKSELSLRTCVWIPTVFGHRGVLRAAEMALGRTGKDGENAGEIRKFLEGLRRADLQSLAKENNVAANKKSAEIIDILVQRGLQVPQIDDARESPVTQARAPPFPSEENEHEKKKAPSLLLRTAAAEEQEQEEEADNVSDWSEKKEDSGYSSDDNDGQSGADVALQLSSALSGLGAIVVYPAHGDFELELPVAAAQFGPRKDFVKGTLNADVETFFPPHCCEASRVGAQGMMQGQVAVMQRGGGVSFVKKALIAQELGAAALIIANTDDALFQPADPAGEEGARVSIPVWLIGAKDSMALQERLDSALKAPNTRLHSAFIAP